MKINEIQEDSNGVVLIPLDVIHEDSEDSAEEALIQAVPEAKSALPLVNLPPAVWALIFSKLYKMTGRSGSAIFTMFLLGTLSREFDQLIPKIPMGSFGEYPRGDAIFSLYSSKYLSLNAARGLVQNSVETLNDGWNHGTSYTSRQLIAYRGRYEAGARMRPAERDIILKIAEIQQLLIALHPHSKQKQEKIHKYGQRTLFVMMVGAMTVLGCWIYYLQRASETHCHLDARPDDQECIDTRARKKHYTDLRDLFGYVLCGAFSLLGLVWYAFEKTKKWEAQKLFNSYISSSESLATILRDTPLSHEEWLSRLDQIKIVHPFLTEEEQAANIETLDALLMKLKSQLDVESGQPAREMLRM